jgi:hypothetical protein
MRNRARDVAFGDGFGANYGNSQGCSGTSCEISRTIEVKRGVEGSFTKGNLVGDAGASVYARATGRAGVSADLKNGRLNADARGEVGVGADARASLGYKGKHLSAEVGGSAQVAAAARGNVGADIDVKSGTFRVGAEGEKRTATF